VSTIWSNRWLTSRRQPVSATGDYRAMLLSTLRAVLYYLTPCDVMAASFEVDGADCVIRSLIPTDSFSSSSSDSPLCSSTTPSLFHSRLKTYLFHNPIPRSFTSSPRTAFADYCPDRFFWATRFLFLVFSSYFFVSVLCVRLSWPYRQLLSARKYILSYRIVSYRRAVFPSNV